VSPTGWVVALAFSRDGRTLSTGSEDNTARLWNMHVPSWQQRLCDLAGRNLTESEWDEFLPDRPLQKTCANQP
jgi:WD40 repeat protein